MIEWDKLKAMPEAKKSGGVRWDELKAMPDVSAIRWEEIKRLRDKPIYAAAIRQANERLAMAESEKKPGSEYKIGLDEMWDMDYDGKSTEELLYDLACEKYGIPNDRESYLKRAGKQVLLGNYTDDVTALGTAGQMLLGLTGLDAPADVRDLYYDLTHWDWSLGHAGQTALDAISLLPGVGAIKYADEAGEVAGSALKRLRKTKKLPEVGTKVAQSYRKSGGVPNRRVEAGLGSAKAPDHSTNTAEELTDDEWDAAMGEFLEILDERKAAEGIGEFSSDIESGDFTGKLWHDDSGADSHNPARPIGVDKPTEAAAASGKIYSPANPHPTLSENVQNSFAGGTFTEKVLTRDTTFYRVYGGKAGQVGSYMSRTQQHGGMQSQLDLALNPDWGNTAAYISKVTVPKGTVIYEGKAAPQVINGGAGMLYGGGNQVYIPKEELNPLWFRN